MSPYTAALDAALDAASTASVEQFQERLSDVVDLLPTARAAERDAALHRIADALPAIDPTKASLLALGCGGIVEYGGDPLIAIDAILAQFPSALSAAFRYRDACRAERDRTGEPPRFFFDASLELSNANAWDTLEPLCRGAIAMLARSREARSRARNWKRFGGMVESLSADHDAVMYLSEILDVLDDEDLIVLHPAERLGFRVHIVGIADNFQLHTLLADALIGDPFDGWISGRPVRKQVAAAARDQLATEGLIAESRFDLFHWQGLQADGTLPPGLDGTHHWLWLENRPADIDLFEGMRIVLLGSPAYVRTWNAARRFDAMRAELTVTEKLSREGVDEWLQRLAKSRNQV